MGFKEKAYRSQQRPMKGVDFKERQGFRRIREFCSSRTVSPSLRLCCCGFCCGRVTETWSVLEEL